MKVFKFLISGTFMGVLLIVFAVAIAYATFIENDYDAITAKLLIYNARWFEVLLLLMVINFTGMIFTRRLYHKSQLNVLIIHLALIIIILGAAITRYIGFEGQMHIRNGEITNKFQSADTYFFVKFIKGTEIRSIDKRIMISPLRKDLFNETFDVYQNLIDVSILDYYPNAVETLVSDESGFGSPYLNVIVGGADGRHQIYLKEGESKVVHNFGLSFGDTTNTNVIQIVRRDNKLFMKFPVPVNVENINDDQDGVHQVDDFIPVDLMTVHTYQDASFVVKEFFESAVMTYRPITDDSQGGIPVVKVRVNEKDDFLQWGKQKEIQVNEVTVALTLGYKALELPFSLKLNEFQLERYPGSDSPSSFASEITLIDERNNIERSFRIFMNNILEYQGYRFYQSSYDRDEQGTILSVNHDYWGTVVTYFGYFLLFGSLIISFFTRKTRFTRILQQLRETHEERKKIAISIVVILISAFGIHDATAQEQHNHNVAPIDKDHAADFGKLQVQNQEGRIMPISTMATQILVKIYKKSSYENLTAEQVFLGMVTDHAGWQEKPLIRVNDQAIQSLLGIRGREARFIDFLDENGKYKLKKQVDQAYINKPVLRTKYDKELINVNERVNIAFMVLNGTFLKIFPLPNHPNNDWVTPSEFQNIGSQHQNLENNMFADYIKALSDARTANNYQEVNKKLAKISNYQKEVGHAIVLSESKTNLEIFYNKVNIFKRLFPLYLILGSLLVGIFFIQIFKPVFEFKLLIKVFFGILFIAFVLQTLGLILRWHISGHAPWSNGYESMIYISWATMLAGLIFMKKSPITLSVTALLAGITLLTAHMSWMNPEITNLVPVLKSYWLTIHVATITASYGFLGLATMMGFLNLCIMIFKDVKNQFRVNLILKELTLIIEMSIIVGLVLLIIGNFLGGIWANESWGRYWGWDPKETWTLVTIILYSFILHMGLIPSMKNRFSFNFMAMFGFCAVLMTYFGVNYFLSGLHSYAGGDQVPVPNFVYYTLLVMATVSVLAGYNEYKLEKSMAIINKSPDLTGNKLDVSISEMSKAKTKQKERESAQTHPS